VSARPRVAVLKFASCDGCQLQLLNLEEELLDLAERVEIARFLEATSRVLPGPYDLAILEGSITTERDVARIRELREASRIVVAIGACATAGGVQALRNGADAAAWKASVYPDPDLVAMLPRSEPASAFVKVDHEVSGCPPSRRELSRAIARALLGAEPDLPGHSVCLECKRAGHVCVLVARGVPCLGPVTRAGCGALCPALGRDCYGCFGPCDDPDPAALARRFRALGLSEEDAARRFRGVAGEAPAWSSAAADLASEEGGDA